MTPQRTVYLLAWLALAPFWSRAQQPAPPAPAGLLVIRNVNVVDVVGERVQANCMVVVRDGCIESVGNRAPAGRAVQRLNGRGKYLIPGLWDAHVAALSTAVEARVALPLYLTYGITSIRNFGTARPLPELLVTVRAVETGELTGPHIMLAGVPIEEPVGAPAGAAARVAGRQQAEAGLLAGWQGLTMDPFLSRDTYLGVAEVAREQHVPLVGPVPEALTSLAAVEAGQRGFEPADKLLLGCSGQEAELVASRSRLLTGPHRLAILQTQLRTQQRAVVSSFSPARCAALGQALAASRAFVVPMLLSDFYPDQALATTDPRFRFLPESVRQQWARTNFSTRNLTTARYATLRPLDSLQHLMVAEFQRQGVTIVAGSNAGWQNPYRFHGSGLLAELEQLVAAGFTPAEALQAATTSPAAALGHRYDLGHITPEYHADLVLLDANPLDDIRNLRQVRAVVLSGRVFNKKALEALEAEAEQQARAVVAPAAAATR
ncbi:amidohydrolase family protein [Hymenobacter persicinus]|uniref:Amidohydrolase-related domain-containing protein n=1 Tax=Hymenobacter persicinus TaxID=2025506 RepID=A0A4Q5LDY4_9BACT|nr:amidohydrolase family protein [Hymenobacter persicinus]RYU78529.1 hypothetical protein EWM57_13475 [Hymenobacter persicinus]